MFTWNVCVLLTSVSLKSSFRSPAEKQTNKQTGLRTLFRGTQRRFPPKCIENTFQAIQSTFSSLEMHFKRCYKICICSVVLGQLESFRNYKGLRIIFPKILDAILSFTKVRIFLIPPSIACLGPKILGFLFQRNTSKLDHHVLLREIRGRGRRDMPGSLCKGSFKKAFKLICLIE